jgi:serine/threonine-protein kinase
MQTTPNPNRPAAVPVAATPTVDASTDRCPMALITASGTRLTGDTVRLLRYRLGIAALITLFPNFFFLVLHLADPGNSPRWFGLSGRLFDLLIVLIAGGVSALLWSRRPLTACTLRRLEVVLFGATATFFAWLQVRQMMDPDFLDWIKRSATHITRRQVFSTVLSATGLRWFFLIVLYGVFIPNTWQRCAMLVSSVAILPLGLTLGFTLADDRLAALLPTPLLILTLILLAAVAIAISGSLRIHMLQQQAEQYRKLGQYRLHEKLGSGGMGEVYLGEHVLLRRPCAIKLIHPDQAGDAKQLSRFEREVRAMANLTHWNTVEIFDYGRTEEGTFFYVMEYLPGMNLESLVQHFGPLPPGRVVHLLRQMCLALREAHGIALLHRDLKPSNIIACQRGGFHDVVKLLDFGLVQDLGLGPEAMKLTVQGTILGSPPYMSPEQARGRQDLSPASDIYSVGGIAYFLLTGQPPFVRETIMEMLIAHASETVSPPGTLRSDIPSDLEAVVMRCLAKEPGNRFTDAESLESALAACACANEWTEAMAAEWWRSHGETVSVRPPANTDGVPTRQLTPLSV